MRAAQRFGRYGVWAIPVFALLTVAVRGSGSAFSPDPAKYARYLGTGRFQPVEAAAAFGTGLVGVLAALALGALLLGCQGRWFAIAGVTCALIGSATLLGTIGSVIVRVQHVGTPSPPGRVDAAAATAAAKDVARAAARAATASTTVRSGVGLLIVGWVLLGIAVVYAYGLNSADGVLLALSAPLLYIGGMFLRVVPAMGSFLLLAAGLGIALAAGRVIAGRTPVVRPVVPRPPVPARLAGSRWGASRGVSTAWSVTREGAGVQALKWKRHAGKPRPSTGPASGRAGATVNRRG